MPAFSQKAMDHFTNPRNVGEIDNCDGMGEVGNPVCGLVMTFYIRVQNEKLKDIKFKTFGCAAAIAVSRVISELVKGKTLKECAEITPIAVTGALEGLPKDKSHCPSLGIKALKMAIENYNKNAGKVSVNLEG